MRLIAPCCALLLLLVSATPCRAQIPDFSGLWVSDMYGSTLSAEIVQQGPLVDGVVTVVSPLGGETVYHVKGAIFESGHVCVLHGAGHVFEGDLDGPDGVSGILTTKSGSRYPLTAKRRQPGAAAPPAEASQPVAKALAKPE